MELERGGGIHHAAEAVVFELFACYERRLGLALVEQVPHLVVETGHAVGVQCGNEVALVVAVVCDLHAVEGERRKVSAGVAAEYREAARADAAADRDRVGGVVVGEVEPVVVVN